MRLSTAILSAIAVAGTAGAQAIAVAPQTVVPARAHMIDMNTPRAVIGVTTAINSGSRDTLGLLVSAVTRGGPAEKAGIEEGNRIAMINGVSLRLATADLGDPDTEHLMSRRLVRELDKLKPGDEVELRVTAGGPSRTIKVKTIDPDSLYDVTSRQIFRDLDERASLGIGYAATGSKRDTLGVFVLSVDEDGPAAKAGIEEGARLQSINGVDLRVAREDAGDELVSAARINRLERELNKAKAGDAVELRIYQNGQSRTVKATAVSAMEQGPNRARVIRSGAGVTIIRRPDAVTMDVNGVQMAAAAKRVAEVAATVAGRAIGAGWGGTIRW